MTTLYFAYGSNMNPDVMREHGGLAEVVGRAYLDDWGLREREHADIEAAAGECVEGVLWRIDEVMARALDDYESVPDYYEDCEVVVRLHADGSLVEATSYRMSPVAARARAGLKFEPDYARLCADGARRQGIPVHALFAEGAVREL